MFIHKWRTLICHPAICTCLNTHLTFANIHWICFIVYINATALITWERAVWPFVKFILILSFFLHFSAFGDYLLYNCPNLSVVQLSARCKFPLRWQQPVTKNYSVMWVKQYKFCHAVSIIILAHQPHRFSRKPNKSILTSTLQVM